MPRCSDDCSTPQPTAKPMTAPSCSTTNVVKSGSSKSASMSATDASTVGGVCSENTGERAWCSGSETSMRPIAGMSRRSASRSVRPGGTSNDASASGTSRIAWTCCCPNPTRNQASTSAGIGRRHDGVVAGGALLDPAARGEPVQVAHRLGLGHRVAGALDPAVGAPHRRARRAQRDSRRARRRDGRRPRRPPRSRRSRRPRPARPRHPRRPGRGPARSAAGCGGGPPAAGRRRRAQPA